MNKWMFVLLFIALIGLGGCQMGSGDGAQKPADMDPEELPDVRAFQDEFTREFLQSTVETRDGYYPFLSGTGRYEMDFPADGVISEKSYSEKNNGSENLVISTMLDGGGMQIQAFYNIILSEDRIERHLNRIEKLVQEELQFEETILEDKIIYFAEFFSDSKDDHYVAYIQNTMDDGGVELRISIDSSVSIDQFDLLEEVKDLAKSVKFVNKVDKVND